MEAEASGDLSYFCPADRSAKSYVFKPEAKLWQSFVLMRLIPEQRSKQTQIMEIIQSAPNIYSFSTQFCQERQKKKKRLQSHRGNTQPVYAHKQKVRFGRGTHSARLFKPPSSFSPTFFHINSSI